MIQGYVDHRHEKEHMLTVRFNNVSEGVRLANNIFCAIFTLEGCCSAMEQRSAMFCKAPENILGESSKYLNEELASQKMRGLLHIHSGVSCCQSLTCCLLLFVKSI